MTIKKVPAQEARVEVTVSFTEEEFKQIETNAAWRYGGGVSAYVRACALGKENHRSC